MGQFTVFLPLLLEISSDREKSGGSQGESRPKSTKRKENTQMQPTGEKEEGDGAMNVIHKALKNKKK